MNCCQITPILCCVGLVTGFFFGVSRKPRGSFAEAPRKEHMPKQRYSLPMPSQSPSPRQTNVAKEKGQKMKANEGPKGQNERKWNQPQPETLENVVALWSRKQKLRKQGRGSSRKGYMWNACRGSWRCGRGRIAEDVAEAMNNFLSTTKEKKTKLRCQVTLYFSRIPIRIFQGTPFTIQIRLTPYVSEMWASNTHIKIEGMYPRCSTCFLFPQSALYIRTK